MKSLIKVFYNMRCFVNDVCNGSLYIISVKAEMTEE